MMNAISFPYNEIAIKRNLNTATQQGSGSAVNCVRFLLCQIFSLMIPIGRKWILVGNPYRNIFYVSI